MTSTGWTEWVRVDGKVHHGVARWPAGVSTDDVVVTPEEIAAADEEESRWRGEASQPASTGS